MSLAEAPPRRRRGLGLVIAGLVAWVLILMSGIVALFVGGGSRDPSFVGQWDEVEFRVLEDGKHKIAMIEITGEIFSGRGTDSLFGAFTLASDDWISQIEQAREDDSVKGVIVRLNTPGGGVVASDQVYEQVRILANEKPVVALMEDTAASGGYYIAAGADHIVANRSTITGSIGVIAMFPNLEGTADKLGYRTVVIKSGKLKDIGSPFREMTKEERLLLQELIDESYDQFVGAVGTGRKLSREKVLELADGRVLSGEQARAAGLVDELGDMETAAKYIRRTGSLEGGERIVLYTAKPVGFGEAFFGGRAGVAGQVRDAIKGARAELTGVPSRAGLHYLWLG